ncbi:hypothetical protein QJQ45_026533 [Haematococcus lacustris]|nr:hypothetical protein QJQ45_026533 [Haematococcus lacustris]
MLKTLDSSISSTCSASTARNAYLYPGRRCLSTVVRAVQRAKPTMALGYLSGASKASRRTFASRPVRTSAASGLDNSPEQGNGNDSGSNIVGYAALFGVALLWGSYTPAIKLLYDLQPPPDPPLLNALQACLSALFLITANITASITHRPVEPHPEVSNPLMAEDAAVRRATLRKDSMASKGQGGSSRGSPPPTEVLRQPANWVEKVMSTALSWQSNNLLVVGAEIGLWMCLAFGYEVAGVQLTSATKAAFLNQASVLITPLLVHLSGAHVRGVEWGACGLGLLGSALVAADSFLGGTANAMEGGAAAAAGSETMGQIFVLVSAVFFALSTVRLGRYSSMFPPLQLSTACTSGLGLGSLAWLAYSIFDAPDGWESELGMLNAMAQSPVALLTVIWVGLGPGALAAFLQAVGQKNVPPAQAQVIYSTTPLWAAAFAFLALDASDEAMGGIAWAGAAVMLASSLLTALSPPESPAAAAARKTPQPALLETQPYRPPLTASHMLGSSQDREVLPDGRWRGLPRSPSPSRRPSPERHSQLDMHNGNGNGHWDENQAYPSTHHSQFNGTARHVGNGSGGSLGVSSAAGAGYRDSYPLRLSSYSGNGQAEGNGQGHHAEAATHRTITLTGQQQQHEEEGYGRDGSPSARSSEERLWGALRGPRASPPPFLPMHPEEIEVVVAPIHDEVRARQGLKDVV